MELRGQRVIVVGLGKSGQAAAEVCHRLGARVLGTDCRPLDELGPEVRRLPVELVTGTHQGLDFAQADLVVISPGVTPWPALLEAERAGLVVVSELELACRLLDCPVVCVGGTNGKSTTAVLMGKMLEAAGLAVFVGGNLGTPATRAVGGRWDLVLLEVSSFQLERAPTLHPRVSVLLNVTEDHLDRYPDFAAYARTKGQAFVNQAEHDVAVVPDRDPVCLEQARRGRARVMTFGVQGDYRLAGDGIRECSTGLVFSLADTALRGGCNPLNAAAAIAAVRSLGVDGDAIRQGLRTFVPLPHRLARVGSLRGVTFYDDSKATNVGAAVVSLTSLGEQRVVLIAGGRDKLGSYRSLVQALEHKGRALVVLGEAAQRIADAVGNRLPVEHARSLEEAVERAFRLAGPGDAVLLAPACSSFDMFGSYSERGERFVAAARGLAARLGEEMRP